MFLNFPKILLILSVSIGLLVCGARGQVPPRVRPSANDASNIRKVDFRNFTYQSDLCSQEIRGISASVKIRGGSFQNEEVSYGVVGNKVFYGDLTADGREEAVVHNSCGELGGNFGLSEIFIYTFDNGRAVLRAKFSDSEMERDYLRHYPSGTLGGVAHNGVKVRNGYLNIERFAEGSHASPEFLVTLVYKLRSGRLELQGPPARRRR
jgi:hypothetical protein